MEATVVGQCGPRSRPPPVSACPFVMNTSTNTEVWPHRSPSATKRPPSQEHGCCVFRHVLTLMSDLNHGLAVPIQAITSTFVIYPGLLPDGRNVGTTRSG